MGAGHSHDTGEATPRNRLLIAFSITASVFVVEVFGAVITGSLALLVDAAHMLTDVIGLAMAVTAAHLMNRPPSDRYTFGLRRAEVLEFMRRLNHEGPIGGEKFGQRSRREVGSAGGCATRGLVSHACPRGGLTGNAFPAASGRAPGRGSGR